MFYSKDSTDFFYRISRRKPITVVGRVPVRTVDQLNPTYISGQPQKTTSEVTDLSSLDIDSDWGVITRIDSIDYDSIREDIPAFVFYSSTYTDVLADSISTSGILNFEVIGGNTADIAQELESQVGEDLNLMLKFGRKITNFEGLENRVLSVDTVALPFPYEDLSLDRINYYEDLGIFTLTLTNNGNVDVYSFSNIDFGGDVVSDDERHLIMAGTSKTIPYNLSADRIDEQATLTIRYGYAIPLQNAILGDRGTPIIEEDVEIISHTENPIISFTKSEFNHKTGLLSIGYKVDTENEVKAQAEMTVNGDVYTSKLMTLSPGRSPALPIEFPYISNDYLVDKYFNITIYYGEDDLLFVASQEIFIEETTFNIIIVIIPVAVIVVILLLFFVLRGGRGKLSSKNASSKESEENKKKLIKGVANKSSLRGNVSKKKTSSVKKKTASKLKSKSKSKR